MACPSPSCSTKTTQSESDDEDTSGYNCEWEDSEPLSDLSDTESGSPDPESDECHGRSIPDICENSILGLRKVTQDRVPESESGREKAMKMVAVAAAATSENPRQSRKLRSCMKTTRRLHSHSHRKRFTSPVDQQKTVAESWAWKKDKERRLRKRQQRELKILQLKRAILRRHMRYRMLKIQYEYYLKLEKRRKRLVIIRGSIRYFMLLVTVLLGIGVFLELLPGVLSIPEVLYRFLSSSRGRNATPSQNNDSIG